MSEILRTNEILSKGYGVSPKLVMIDENLTIEAKAIYAYLSSFCGSGNIAFPTVKLITSHLKISSDRFYKHFNLLVKQGYITKEQTREENGTFKGNTYTLNTVVKTIEEVEDTQIIDEDEPREEIAEEVETVGEKAKYEKSVYGNSRYGKPETNNNSINNNSINNNSINNKKEKYKKEKKEKKKSEFDLLVDNYTKNQELKQAVYDFIIMRKTIKEPLTTRALNQILNKLNEYANDDDTKIKILEQSIERNWMTVYELKDSKDYQDYGKKGASNASTTDKAKPIYTSIYDSKPKDDDSWKYEDYSDVI